MSLDEKYLRVSRSKLLFGYCPLHRNKGMLKALADEIIPGQNSTSITKPYLILKLLKNRLNANR